MVAKEGINAVKESLCSVDSATADAWSPDDKEAAAADFASEFLVTQSAVWF